MDRLKLPENIDKYRYWWYLWRYLNFESLLTDIPVSETNKYMLIGINIDLKPSHKNSILKKLWKRLRKDWVFPALNLFIKKVDYFHIGGHMSVLFANIYVWKKENDLVESSKVIFYKRYVDDTCVKRRYYETYRLFDPLKSNYPNT